MNPNGKDASSSLRRFPNGHSYNYTDQTKKRIKEWLKTHVDQISIHTAIGTKNVIKSLAEPDSITGYFKSLIERDTKERMLRGDLSKEKAKEIITAYKKELAQKNIENREDPSIVKILSAYVEGKENDDRAGN